MQTNWTKVKFYGSVIFKILLLAIGFADFFNLVPQAYKIFSDVLTAYIFMIFWLELNITGLMFGEKNKLIDKLVIWTFYILVINTFVQWVRVIDLSDPVIIRTFDVFSKYVPYWLSNSTKSLFLFVHNPANMEFFSLLASYLGFSLLALVTVYIVFKMKFSDKSLVYCISSIFINDGGWNRINNCKNNGKYALVKLVLAAVTILGIFQYLFLLITQWFLVSMGKTLLIFAIIYAVKDIQGSKIKTLNKIGQFDDVFLGWVTEYLTNAKKFYLSFSVLLILHYMSDLSTFFVSFFIPSVEIDPYFVTLMSAEAYQPLINLITADAVWGLIETWWVYVMSTIGTMMLIILPMIILFFTILLVDLNKLVENKRFQIIQNVIIVAIATALAGPWVKQLVIKSAGIQGVNFVTQAISASAAFSIPLMFWMSALAIVLLTMILIIFRKNAFAKYIFIIEYLISMFYLGEYIWNYFQSSVAYHTDIILYSGKAFLSIIFSILLVVELMFYIGGFILLCYKFSRYIISKIIHELITDASIIAWTFVFLMVPILILYNLNLVTLTWSCIAVLILFIFTYAMSKELTGKEYRDDYLLGVGITIMTYQAGLIILAIFSTAYGFDEGLLNFIQPIAILIISLICVITFSIKLEFGKVDLRKMLFALIIAAVFGLLFYAINEPKAALPNNAFTVVLAFTLIVALAEEVLFRGILLNLAQRAFSYNKALILQAVVFAGIHFISIKYLLEHYVAEKSLLFSSAPLLLSLYFILLVVFGIMAGLFAGSKTTEKKELIYPIVMHLIVNLIVFLV